MNNSDKSNKLQKYIKDFLEYCEIERGKSSNTIKNYQHYLDRFASWGKKNNVTSPSNINLDSVKKYRLYLNSQSGKNLKKKTQNYHIIALRAFLKFLAKNDIKTLSAEKIELAKQEDREINVLTDDELERLFNSIEGTSLEALRDRAIIESLFSTGLRVSELVNLTKDKINLKNKEFSVIGKGGKTRIVFLSDDSKKALQEYLDVRKDDNKALFVTISKNKTNSISVRSVQRILKKYSTKAGIVKKVTPHVLRHTFGTDLLRSGADIRSVQKLLGHSSITSTQIYTHVTDKQLKEVHNAFHGIRKNKK